MSLRPPVTMKMAFKPERFRKTFQVYFQRSTVVLLKREWMSQDHILRMSFIPGPQPCK